MANFDFYSALSGIGDTLQQNRQRSEGARSIADMLDAISQPQGEPSAPAQPAITSVPNNPIAQRVAAAANKYGVPVNLALKAAGAESNFNQAAVSPKGATGVMQLMPGTARDLGVDPLKTDDNIEGGVRYLKQQLDKYGKPELALAAYNAGPGRVDQYLAGQGDLPAETKAYVAKITGGAAQPQAAPNAQAGAGPIAAPTRAINPALKEKLAAMFASGDPNAQKFALAIVSQYITPKNYGFQTLPDGTVLRTDPMGGSVSPVFQSAKPEIKETGTDFLGNKTFSQVYPNGKIVPIGPNGQPVEGGQQSGQPGAPAGIDPTLSGEDYLKQFPADFQAAVKDYVAGKSTPTGNPRRGFAEAVKKTAAKYAQDLGLSSDDTTFAARRSMRNSLSNATPGSLGGQLNLGNTAVGHLAELAAAAGNLDNVDVGLTGPSHLVNAVRGYGTGQAAKLEALKSAAQHYGQEVTRFYAGSPGGEGERNRFMESVSGAKTPQELASVLETEASLMRDRLGNIDSQVKGVLGPMASDYPTVRPETEAAFGKIAQTVRKLRGQSGVTPQAEGSQQTAPAQQPKLGSVKIPMDAVKDLRADPSPERRKYFDDIFGVGASQRVIGR